MNPGVPLAFLADLADYPGPGFAAHLALWPQACAAASPVVHGLIADFAARSAALPPTQLEELYAATFDLQPDCTLNLGHHLFGEDWKRSSLLIELASSMQRAGLELAGELPDHLCWLLRFLDRMPWTEESGELTACILLPGVRALCAKLSQDHLYQPLLHALELRLADQPLATASAAEATA
ncbi:MAG: nitrate reductase molybdenum cofactor assembly chaperone [Terriglobales bacterium]